MYDSGLKGIRMVNSSYMLVDNNSVYDNSGSYGIDVYMKTMPYLDSHNITISNNTIERNLYGIELFGLDCTIRDNNVLNNTEYGIYVMGNDSKICNNTIQDNTDYGVKLYNSARNYVYCNNFTDNNADNPGLQAWDNGAANDNHWNTTIGNYWSDWQSNSEFPCNYTIDGGSNKDYKPMGPYHVYNFSCGAGTDKWAYRWQVNAKPPDLDDNTIPNTEFFTTEYANITVDDGTFQSDDTSTDGYFAAHRFNFSIAESVSSIAKINVTWNGIGCHDKNNLDDGAVLYIWNFSSPGYEQLADSGDTAEEVTLTGEVTASISSYINSSNVTVLVVQKNAHDIGGQTYISHIETDYVRVVVAP